MWIKSRVSALFHDALQEAGGLNMIQVMAAFTMLAVAFAAHAQPAQRSGEQIVKQQCAKCHQTGVSGAPKIDDRAAWAPRMKQGLDATVRSAMRGHGKMPARGGLADLSDNELRAAIVYMFYPAGASLKGGSAQAAAPDYNRKVVDGTEIYLGVMPAGAAGRFHVNISLVDEASKAQIKDAAVEARVASAMGGSTKKLNPTTVNERVSYSNDFMVSGSAPHTITVSVARPKRAPLEARFDLRR
jgi:cytochrome c5